MKQLCGFKKWIIESLLQYEATIGFGKHRGQSDDEVPAGYWKYLLNSMEENPGSRAPSITDDNGRPLTRDQVLALARNRAQGGRRVSRPSQEEPREPEPAQAKPKSLVNASWILAKVVNVPDLTPGDYVVVTKSTNGDFILMTRTGHTKRLAGNG